MNKLELYGLFLAVVIGAFFSGRYVEWDKIRIEQKAADQQHKQELKDAGDKHAQEIHDIFNAKPLPPVRLCKPVQVGQTPGTSTSSPTGNLPTVPSGDNPVRPEQPSSTTEQEAGPNIANLLGLLERQAEYVSADLRLEEGVK